MCDVATMLIASTVVGAAGQVYTASANANAAEYSAEVNQQNAILADRRATDAIERGQMEEERKKREATLLRKGQEASFAASNIDTGYGTPLDIITSSAMAADLDAAIIRSNAEREAEDYEIQSVNYRNQSSQDKTTAKGARVGGLIGAAGVALNGGAGIFKYRASTA